MGSLRDLQTRAVRPLPARLLVGRAPSCTLCLEDRRVSGEHATILWTGTRWEVRDLGSRNGTFLDGVRLEPGVSQGLERGSRVSFGTPDSGFELVEPSPPSALAEDLTTGALLAAEGGILALPSPADPLALVYTDARGRWVAEQGEDPVEIDDGHVLTAGRPFRIRLPAAIESTAPVDVGPRVDTVRLRFYVSRDEEHVELGVVHRGQETRLDRREHWYGLLTLARRRMEEAGLPLSEQGWVDRDRLLRMLQVDANAFNVAMYRARGQLAAAGVEGAAGVVEVRRGQRRIGIEPDRLEIVAL